MSCPPHPDLRGLNMTFDSLSHGNLMDPGVVPEALPPEWRWVRRGGKAIGAGRKITEIEGKLEIQGCQYTWSDQPAVWTLTVMRLPKGIQIAIGNFNIRGSEDDEDPLLDGGHSILIDYAGFRVIVREFKEKVRLDWLTSIIRRQQIGPESKHNVANWL